ncbi:hypothetical protein [Deinococcus aestuarii]|uniref:hypothetical protein n=1 Tax=Deinococcus aestuarii TaxID=2774531 RepID=UPI001C0E8308|nr:hypothetical protein [Deinococcus aestuarii]
MKSPLALALAAVTLSGSVLTGGAGAQTLAPFTDPKLPFTVSLPRGWLGANFNDGTGGVSVVSAKTPPATLIRLLYVSKDGRTPELKQEFRNFEAGVTQTGGKVKLFRGRNVTYGGVKGVEREYLITGGQTAVRVRIWFGNGAKNLYSFQVTDTPERYAKSSALFSQVLASVRFRP